MSLNDNQVLRSLSRLQGRFQRFGASLRNIGAGLLGAGLGLGTPLAFVTKMFADFDDQMRAVRAVTSATEDDFRMLTDLAKELGRTTSFTAAQVASGMLELGRATGSAKAVQALTDDMLNLARATGVDLPLAAQVMTNTLNSLMNRDLTQATRVADVLAGAVNNSAMDLQDMAYALKDSAPLAAQFNVTIEELAAMIAALADAGFRGTNANTVLKNLSLRAAGNAQAFRKFGVEVADANGDLRKMPDILRDVLAATAAMGTQESGAVFTELFGLRAVGGGAALIKARDRLDELLTKMREMNGYAAKTAAEMDAGIGGAMRRLQSAAEGVIIAIGEILAPILSAMGDQLTMVATAVTPFLEKNKEIVVTVLAVVSGLTVAGAAFLALGLTVTTAASMISISLGVLGAVKAILLGLLSPAGLIAAAFLAVGAAAYWAFFTQTESGSRALATLSGWLAGIADTARSAAAGIMDALKAGDLTLAAEIAFTALSLEWAKVVAVMTATWNVFKGVFVDGWHELAAAVESIWNDLTAGIRTAWEMATTSVVAGMQFAAEQVLRVAAKAFRALDQLDPTGKSGKAADALEGWADSFGDATWKTIREGKKAIDEIAKQQAARTEEIGRELAEALERANKARGEDLRAALEDVRRLEQELADLRRKAEEAAAAAVPAPAQPGAAGQPVAPGGGRLRPTIGPVRIAAIAGGLASPGLAQQFGVAAGNFEKRQLDAMEGTEKNTGAMAEGMDELIRAIRFK